MVKACPRGARVSLGIGRHLARRDDALQLFLRKRLADFMTTFDVTAAAYAA